jgi:hypothetical protein
MFLLMPLEMFIRWIAKMIGFFAELRVLRLRLWWQEAMVGAVRCHS